jgi:hypothetical protein
MGSALEAAGRLNEAASEIEQALRLAPTLAAARQALARIDIERRLSVNPSS